MVSEHLCVHFSLRSHLPLEWCEAVFPNIIWVLHHVRWQIDPPFQLFGRPEIRALQAGNGCLYKRSLRGSPCIQRASQLCPTLLWSGASDWTPRTHTKVLQEPWVHRQIRHTVQETVFTGNFLFRNLVNQSVWKLKTQDLSRDVFFKTSIFEKIDFTAAPLGHWIWKCCWGHNGQCLQLRQRSPRFIRRRHSPCFQLNQ